MSLLINKYLLFDKAWKKLLFVIISIAILGFSVFSIFYVSLADIQFYKIPIITLSLTTIILWFFVYLALLKGAKKAIIIILSVLLVICIAFLNVITFMLIIGKSAMLKNPNIHVVPPDIDAIIDANGIVSYEDKQYIYNEDITTILFMGVDKKDIDNTSINGRNGQADAVYAAVIDTKTGKTTVICISRDTWTDIKIYSKEGNYIRTEGGQLCLSYAYGDGKNLSCENCVWSASNILCGIPINTYMAVDYSAIAILNDAVGGVEVPAYTRDWSKKTGKTTVLYGNEAYEYVQYRNTKVTESNAYRITRQLDYLKSFSKKAIDMTKKDISTPINLYNKINGYSVNNLSVDKIAFLASVFLSGSNEIDFRNIEGTIDTDGEHAYFTPDSEKLYKLILEVFYKEV